ncbi:MAG: hypothetical protein A2667_03230 [Candidatus Wildermuthbacteria bacterium RIFCSPHIGHO2_01_FULL_47_27]|uniref:DUF3307 domain-containing protein n=2 Tax=Candidatus Wildermuthiibacteriota TaxID=1817923 RepID=A0A1G2RPC9_9BACT|nr:MAG: hypothetical protein UY15_C0020G0020 [Parcubacteria group bacterium GW2011_GWA2_47_9]OHA63450.1 MAG: hypothetical protein A2667_03230 [Candidatus Wildermuthbacteria bacterium RIFCSPHIGHO2_01_FULL_47_27]OHA68105.1 MAG: hypothetical protein A3D59_00900 [Candidatus Wildermuthbacteria bacterium RIFCSPHIGHO2_02_FULL_47_17]OHA74219.1 MAG: hypothetical protein A3A32_02500 [Candidatus Wildermuthbacteria bacterium RIFCSPLOWO2_01_FULL_48_35]OHA75396.1 MAG: hypothetical protein A3I38_01265 [Candid
MEILPWLLAGHFIGDFPFQSEWMAANKGKSWEVNAYHAFVYAFTVFVIVAMADFRLSFWAVLILFASHFIIDPLKARWGIVRHVWMDQFLHIAVLAAIAAFLT